MKHKNTKPSTPTTEGLLHFHRCPVCGDRFAHEKPCGRAGLAYQPCASCEGEGRVDEEVWGIIYPGFRFYLALADAAEKIQSDYDAGGFLTEAVGQCPTNPT